MLKKTEKKKNRKNPHHSLTRVISTASNAANAKEKGTKIRNKVWRLKLEARHKNFIHLLKQTHVLEPTCAHTPVGFMAVQENSCQWTHRSEFLWNGWRRRRPAICAASTPRQSMNGWFLSWAQTLTHTSPCSHRLVSDLRNDLRPRWFCGSRRLQ